MRRAAIGCMAGIAGVFGISAMLAGCPRSEQTSANADASTSASATANAEASAGASANADGHAIMVAGCLSCHSEPMLAQQRLTEGQWSKVVIKMAGWGANVEPAEIPKLVAYLSSSFGPEAGTYEPETLTAAEASAELSATGDAPFPAGDATRGRTLYVEKCSGCHGAEARGHIGVMLIDRPFLYRSADFARTVRRGRGKMLPLPLSDAEIGDVLAHLRSLRNPAP